MEIARYINGKEVNQKELRGFTISSDAMVSAVASVRKRAEKAEVKKKDNKKRVSE